MKNFFIVLVSALVLFSCSNERKGTGNMKVKGKIKGLKKGTLYLQKMVDTVLVSVDSVNLFGKDSFTLYDNVESPVVYYLTFDDIKDKKMIFFGEKGTISITDNMENFGIKPKIKGSKNQELLDMFNKINSKFRDQRLDFIANDYKARATKDTAEVTRLQKEYKKMMRRKFLYTTNFAVNNKDYEVAPYVALSELFDAGLYLLDTINNSLSDKVKKSTYGKQLDQYIIKIKEQSKKDKK